MKVDFIKKCWFEKDIKVVPINGQKIGIVDGPINSHLANVKNIKYCGSENNEEEDSCDFTHASIICSIIKAISPSSEISVAQVISKDRNKIYERDIMNALEWLVVKEKVAIINISLGFYNNGKDVQDWDKRFNLLKKNYNVIVVVSAGNTAEEHPNASITSPGCSKEVITVGALDKDLKVSKKINLNKIPGKPDLYANGYVNLTLLNNEVVPCCGTSFSAPIVVGLIARYYYLMVKSISKQNLEAILSDIFDNFICTIQNLYGVTFETDEFITIKEIEKKLKSTCLEQDCMIKYTDIVSFLKKDLHMNYK